MSNIKNAGKFFILVAGNFVRVFKWNWRLFVASLARLSRWANRHAVYGVVGIILITRGRFNVLTDLAA